MVASTVNSPVKFEVDPLPLPSGQPRRLSEILPEVLRRRGLVPEKSVDYLRHRAPEVAKGGAKEVL
jgi:hypothetical protein